MKYLIKIKQFSNLITDNNVSQVSHQGYGLDRAVFQYLVNTIISLRCTIIQEKIKILFIQTLKIQIIETKRKRGQVQRYFKRYPLHRAVCINQLWKPQQRPCPAYCDRSDSDRVVRATFVWHYPQVVQNCNLTLNNTVPRVQSQYILWHFCRNLWMILRSYDKPNFHRFESKYR